jgi:hypothetical protein
MEPSRPDPSAATCRGLHTGNAVKYLPHCSGDRCGAARCFPRVSRDRLGKRPRGGVQTRLSSLRFAQHLSFPHFVWHDVLPRCDRMSVSAHLCKSSVICRTLWIFSAYQPLSLAPRTGQPHRRTSIRAASSANPLSHL